MSSAELFRSGWFGLHLGEGHGALIVLLTLNGEQDRPALALNVAPGLGQEAGLPSDDPLVDEAVLEAMWSIHGEAQGLPGGSHPDAWRGLAFTAG